MRLYWKPLLGQGRYKDGRRWPVSPGWEVWIVESFLEELMLEVSLEG